MVEYAYDHVHVTSPEPQQVADFFINVMGGKFVREFEIAGRGGVKAKEVNVGGLIIRVSPSTGADPYLKEEYAKATGKDRYGMHHFGMKVDNLVQSVAELKSVGVKFVFPYTGTGAVFVIVPGNVMIELSQKR